MFESEEKGVRTAVAKKQEGTEVNAQKVLEIRDLVKYYGKLRVLKGITFDIRQNDCFGMVGASGAGKTTTFNIIVGLNLP
ncbi:hypothetical protein COOONC_06848 [Cooperia oncophora]